MTHQNSRFSDVIFFPNVKGKSVKDLGKHRAGLPIKGILNWHALFLLFTLILACRPQAWSQANLVNYTFSTNNNGSLVLDLNANAVDMTTGTTTLVEGGRTAASSPVVNIGFDFYFMGTKMNQLGVNQAGIVQLGFSVPAPTSFYGSTANTLSPFGVSSAGGLITGMGPASNGKIHSKVIGSYPNRCLVLEFQNMRLSQNSTTTNLSNLSTWQLRLYERTGVVEYVYGNMFVDNLNGLGNFIVGFNTASAAVQKIIDVSSHTEQVNPPSLTPFSFSRSSTGAITALSSSSNPNRRFYRFTPVEPASPTNLLLSGVSSNGMFLQWNDNSNNESGFDIYISDNGGTSYNWFTSVAANTNTLNTLNIAPLRAGTAYHWQVYARKEAYSSAAASANATTLGGTTITATALGGFWSSTTTWVGGVVPTNLENVVIPVGSGVTLDNSNLNCRNLTVNGTLEYSEAVTATLTVNGNLTVNTGGSLTAGAGSLTSHALTVGGSTGLSMNEGNVTVNGNLDLNTSGGASLTINGYLNGQLSGTGTMDFFSLTFTKGSTALHRDLNPTYELNSIFTIAPAVGSQNRFNVNVGTVKVNVGIAIFPYAGTQTVIGTSARLWINHPNAIISQNTPFTASNGGQCAISGELRIDAGTFTYGSGGNTDVIYAGGTSAALVINGGTLNCYAGLLWSNSNASSVMFTMTGGTINIDDANPLVASNTSFNQLAFGSLQTVLWTGGTIIIRNPIPVAGLITVSMPAGGSKVITGGTLQIGDASSAQTGGTFANNSGFGLNLGFPVWNLVLNNRVDAFPSRMARLTGASFVQNNLTIESNGYLFTGNATTGFNLSVRGNINTASGGKLRGAEPGNTTSFLGSIILDGAAGQQQVGGLGDLENIFGLQVANLSGVALNKNLTFTQVQLSYGTITTGAGNTLTIGRGASGHNPFVIVGSGLTSFDAGNFASAPTFNVSAGNMHLQYIQSRNAIAMGAGNEVPAGSSLNLRRFLLNNPLGVTLSKSLIVDTLTMTSGDITLGANDLTLGTAVTTPGSYSYSAGNIITNSSGLFYRWFPNSGLPTAATNGIGHFPVGAPLTNRHVWLYFSSTTALSTGGLIGVQHDASTGTANLTQTPIEPNQWDTTSFQISTIASPNIVVASMVDYPLLVGDTVRLRTGGTLPTGLTANTNYFVVSVVGNTIQISATRGGTALTWTGTGTGIHRIWRRMVLHRRTNCNWNISSPSNTPLLAAGQNVSLRIQGSNVMQTINSLVDVTLSGPEGRTLAGFVGVGTGASPANPVANRLRVPTISALLSSFYMAAQNANYGSEVTTVTSVATGDWGNPSTWSTGLVPSSNQNVIVQSGHTIALSGGVQPYFANNLTINNGGILNASSDSLYIGPNGGGNRSFLVSGALNISGTATINVNGNMAILNGASFVMGGGFINIDGNNGTAGGSVVNNVDLFSIGHATLGTFSTGTVLVNGGTITIVDPHFLNTSTSIYSFAYRSASPSNVWAGNTLIIGGTTGLNKSGSIPGFNIGTWISSGRLMLGNLIINGQNIGNTINGARFCTTPTTSSSGFECINLTVNANSELRQPSTSSESITVAGNIVNNGLITTLQTTTPSTFLTEGGIKLAMLSGTTEVASVFNQTISGTGNWSNQLSANPTGWSNGVNYQVGDVITITKGTSASPIRLYVASISATGGIASWGVSDPGRDYTVLPVSPFTISGGSGTGASISTFAYLNRTAHISALVVGSQSGNSTQLPLVNPIEWDINNLVVERLSLVNGIVKLDENNFILGRTLNITAAPTLHGGLLAWATPSATALGGFINTTGSFRRVISSQSVTTVASPGTGTTSFPTTIAASGGSPSLGVFPLVAQSGFRHRYFTFAYSAIPTVTTPGIYAAQHFDSAGITNTAGFVETNTYNRVTKSDWVIAMPTAITYSGSATITARIQGNMSVLPSITSTTSMCLSTGLAAPGLLSAGTGTTTAIQANRTSIPFAGLVNNWSICAPNTDLASVTAANGNWNTPATWLANAVPMSSENVIIQEGHTVTLNTTLPAAATCNNLTINTGGALNATGNTLTIGSLSNSLLDANGSLLIDGATLNVNGRMTVANVANSAFTFLSGTINIDGNDGNTLTSVTSGSTLCLIGTTGAVNVIGGNLNIIDPPIGSFGNAFQFSGGTSFVWPNLNLTFGNGSSATQAAFNGTNLTADFGFNISTSGVRIGSLNINSGNTLNRRVSNTGTLWVGNNITISSGSQLRNSSTLGLAGNLINNGEMINTGTLSFSLSGAINNVAQNVTGSGTFRNSIPSISGFSSGLSYNVGDVLQITPNGTSGSPIEYYVTSVSSGNVTGGFVSNFGTLTGTYDNTMAHNMTGGSGAGQTCSSVLSPVAVAMFTNLTVSNSNINGVNMSAVSGQVNAANNFNTVSGLLTLGSSLIDFGSNNFAHGFRDPLTTAATSIIPGSASYVIGARVKTTGAVTRWVQANAAPTIPNAFTGLCPVGTNSDIRYLGFFWPLASSVTTGGYVSVVHTPTTGLNTVTAFTDGPLSINRITNGTWQVSTGGGLASTGAVSIRIYGYGLLAPPSPADISITLASAAAPGTYASGSGLVATQPQANRLLASQADLNNTFRIGANVTNLFERVTIASGNWNDPAIWDGGTTIPGANDNVKIKSGHTVALNTNSSIISLNVQNGATLNAPANDLNITASLTASGSVNLTGANVNIGGGTQSGILIPNNGLLNITNGVINLGPAGGGDRLVNHQTGATLTQTGGTFNINGNITFAGGTFNMSGGNMNIDPNSGVIATSLAPNLSVFNVATTLGGTVNGGTITIIDPLLRHGTGFAFTSSASIANEWVGNTLRFGDGSSSQASGHAGGFQVDMASTHVLGNVIINGGNTSRRFVNVGAISTAPSGNLSATNLTINAGSELRFMGVDAAGVALNISGNFENNGAMVGGASLNFRRGTGNLSALAQTLSGTGQFSTRSFRITSLSVIGTGYAIGDTLTFTGGTAATQSQILVTGIDGLGGINNWVYFTNGVYSVLPTSPVTLTGGTGTGAIVNINPSTTATNGLAMLGRGNLLNVSFLNSNLTGVNWNIDGLRVINSITFSPTSGVVNRVNLGSNSLTLGDSTTTITGTLSWSAGGFTNTTGKFRRWMGTGNFPTTAATSNAGHFPFFNGNYLRHLFLYSSTASALSAGGIFEANHNFGTGLSPITQIVDNGYPINRQGNASWTVSTANASGAAPLAIASGINISLALRGDSLPNLVNTLSDLRIMQASSVSGLHINGTGTTANPQAQRGFTSLADMSNTHYFAGHVSNFNPITPIFTIANGNWADPSIWNTNTVPTELNNVTISHSVNLAGGPSTFSAFSLALNAGGALNANSNTLSVFGGLTSNAGSSIRLNGATVSAATLSLTGSFEINSGTFNLNGGSLTGLTVNSDGAYKQTGGIVNVGIGNNFSRFLVSSSTTSRDTISGGSLNINGNMVVTGPFVQTGGTITIDGNSGAANTSVATNNPLFHLNHNSLANGCLFNGGTIVIVDPHHQSLSSATLNNQSIYFQTQSAFSSFSGTHTFQLGDGISTTPGIATGFAVETYGAFSNNCPIQNLVVNGGNGINRFGATSAGNSTIYGTYIKGNLTINAGSEFRHVNSVAVPFEVGGNIVNNGIFTNEGLSPLLLGSTGVFVPQSAQTLSGTGVFRNLVPRGPSPYTLPPAVTNPINDEDVGNITITRGATTILNNTTAVNSLSGTIGTAGSASVTGSYSDFTAYGPYSLNAGVLHGFSVSSVQTTGNYANAMAIWIDYNQNGVFTDVGEQIHLGGTVNGNHTQSGTFTVPITAISGNTRMRVLCNEGAITGPTMMTVGYGEYEEYTVNIVGGTGLFQMPSANTRNITINNTVSGAVVTSTIDSLSVSGSLILTSGRLATTGKITMLNGSAISRTNGFVDGYLERYFATGANVAQTYFTGTGAQYSPITLTYPSVTTAGYAKWKSIGGDHPEIDLTCLNANASVNRHFDFGSNTVLPLTYNANFTYGAADNDAVVTPANYVAYRYTNSTWSASIAPFGTPSNTNFVLNGQTALGAFQIGNQPLGVTNTSLASQTGCTGSNGRIITNASGPGLNYQWLFKCSSCSTFVNLINGASYAGVDNDTLTIISATSSQEGQYFCNITTSCVPGAQTDTMTFTLNPALASNTVSDNQTICTGTIPAAFTGSVPTGGNASYNYQWLRSTTNATSGFSVSVGTTSLQNYSFPITLAQNTWLRRLVTSGQCRDTSSSVLVTVNPLISNNIITGAQQIITGSRADSINGSIPTGGNGSYSFAWISRISTSAFGAASGTNTNSVYYPGVLNDTSYYRRVVSAGVCPNDTSGIIEITVNPVIINNIISANQTICTGNVAAQLTGTIPAGGNGTFSYRWLSSTTSATAGFVFASGVNIGSSYNPGVRTATTWFKRIASSSGGADTSAAIEITVNPLISNNNISSSQDVITGTIPFSLNGSTPSGGNGTYIFQWEVSTSGPSTGFANASGAATGKDYIPGALSTDTWYRRSVSAGLCPASTSAAIKMTMVSAIANNTISGVQTICSGTAPSALSGSAPSGASGFYTYQWISSIVGSDANYSQASGLTTLINYTPGVLTSTSWFKRIVFSANGADTSAAVQITVNPIISNNTLTGTQTLCIGSVPSSIIGSTPTGGNGVFTYLWESSTTSAIAGFTTASGTNNLANYSTTESLTVTTWYRRTVSAGVCAANVSSAIQKTVTPVISGNTISSAQTICAGSTPSTLTGSTPSGGNGPYTYLWEISSTSASAGFSAASGTNNAINYSPSALTATTWYRRTVSAGDCPSVNTSAIEVTVNPVISNNTISGTNEVCVGGTPTTITGSFATGGNGTITYLWESSTTSASAGFSNAAGINIGANYAPGALTITTWFRRVVSAGVCPANNSSATQAVVNPFPTPVIAGPSSTCTNSIATYTIASNTGRTYVWNAVGGTITGGQGTASINVGWGSPGAGSVTVSDSVNVTGCKTTTSNYAITITPAIANNSLSGAQTICSGSTPASLSGSTPTLGNGAYTYTWESSTTSATSGFSAALGTNNQLNYTAPSALTTTTWYRRVVGSGDCASNTSAAIQVTVTPVISSNTVTSAQTICTGSVPSTLVGSSPIGGNGPLTYQWQSSTTSASTGYANASGSSTSKDYAPSSLTQTTWYRRIVSSGDCAPLNSMALEVTVNPVIASNTISSPSQVCIGTANANITGSVPTGGNTSYTYLWESSTTSATAGFTAASGVNTGANYTPGILAQTTWFRRVVSAGICPSNTSSASLAQVNAYPTPAVSGLTSICENNSTAYSTPSNAGRSYTWTVTGGTIASGQGTASITVNWSAAGAGSVVVKDSVNATGCATTTAYAVTKNPYPSPVVSGSNTVCSFSSTNFSTPNNPGRTYKWAVTGGVIASGQGSNTVSINWAAPGVGSVRVTDSVNATGCATMSSSFAVSINNSPSPVITGVNSICENNNANYSTPFNSGSAYIWSIVGGNITSGIGTNNITVNWTTAGTGILTVTDSILAGGCKTTTAPYNVAVNAYPTPSISGTTTACISTTHTYSIAANAGRTYNWTVVGGSILSGQGTASISVQWTSAGTGTLVAYDSVNATGCARSSSVYSVIVNPIISANTLTGNQTICTGSTPSGFIGSTPSGGNGTFTYLWESSTASSSSGFSAAAGVNNTINYNAGALITTTWYRRTVSAGVCASSISSAIAVVVNPVITNNAIGSAQTICHNTVPTALTGSSPIGGNSIFNYLWESSTVSGSSGFAPASGTNNAINYSPGSLPATIWFRRTASAGVCPANISTAVKITVQDTTLPTVITKNVTKYLDATGSASIAISDIDNGSTDNCGIASRVLSKTSFNCTNVNVNTVTLTVTDLIGNVNTAIAIVTILDTIKPIVLTKPYTAFLNASGNATINVGNVNNSSTDNCGIQSYALSKTSFNCTNVGQNNVTLTITDVNGNINSAVAVVTVIDSIKPTVNVTTGIVLYLNASANIPITTAMINNGSFDNCGIASMTVSPSTINCSHIGITPITLTVTDVNGNVNTNVSNVVVFDPIAPVARPKARITVYLNANGSALINPTMLDSASTDNCTITSRVISQATFNCSNLGNNTISYTVQDQSGNANAANVIINVLDTIKPLVVTQNINVNLNSSGSATITASQINNGSSDNCSISSLTLSKSTFSCVDLGANTITLAVVDANGNTAVGNATVTVTDNTNPVARPRNLTVYLNASGNASITAILADSASSDNCGVVTRTINTSSFTCNNVGNNTIGLTVTDAANNTNTTNFNVTVLDTIRPIVTAQNRAIFLDANGTASITAAMVNNGSTDNCAISSLVLSKTTFDCTNRGANTVTLTGTDASGNFRTVNATITVSDTTKPALAVNSTVNLYLNASGNATLTTAMVNNGSSDNCGISSLTLSKTAFTGSDIGNNLVTFTATDGSSNSRNTTVTVVVIDSVRPMAIAQNVTAFLNTSGTATVTAAQVNNGSTDNVGAPSLSLSATSFTCSNLGSNNVTLTATDGSGNFRTATAVVTVLDTIRPIVTAQNRAIFLDASGTASITAAMVNNGSTDNCAISSLVLSKTTFDCTNRGANTVTLTGTDASGNFRTVNATITVSDTTKPALAVNSTVNLFLNASGNATLTTAMVNNGSSDNCGISSLTLSKTAFTGSDIGNNLVTFTATDGSSNSRNTTVTVVVIDSVRPMAIAQNVTAYLNASGTATVTAAQVNNGSTDNVGAPSLSLSATSFTCSNLGSNNVTLTVTDGSGNFRTANAIVTILDTIRPIVAAQNITAYIGTTGSVNITAAQLTASSSDNCGIASAVISKSSFDCSNLGSNNVNLTVTDVSGNFRTVNATITVSDTTKPALAVNSTVNLFLNASGNATLTTAMVNNGSTDNCSISTLSLSKTAFTGADLGNNLVTFTATDGSSNSRNTSLTVVVIDSVRPIAIAQNVTAYLNGTGTTTVTAAQVNNGSTDNVGTPSLSLSATSFTCSNLGSNNVTLTVTDGSGNFRTANAIVTVLDTIRPLVAAQNITTYINSSGTASITAAQVTASSSDNCSVAGAVLSKSNFDCSNLGSNNVNLTVTDGSGNFRTVSASVTVLDTIRPIALISNNFNLYLNASGTAALTTAMINNGSSDNCSIANLSLSKTNFTGADLGNNLVVFTVTDNSNNSRSVNVNVIVIDSMKPLAITQNRTIYLNASGNGSITANEVNNGSSDNVGVTGLALSQVNFTCNNVGANSVTLTVSDVSGNFRTANAIITVLDSMKPTANANNLTVYLNSLGFATITEAMANNNSSDNCGTPTIGISKSNFDCSNLGINNLVLTATDRNANVSTTNFTVNVLDTLRPNAVVNNNLNIYLDASGNVNLTAAQVDAGSTDNCNIASLSISKTSFAGINLGLNTITFTATDGSGNFRTVNVNIFVRDTMVPLIKAKNVTVYLGSTGGASINPALIDDNSTDNVGITNRSLSKTFFNCNELGSNQIIYSIRDASGNESSTIFTVSVLDTTKPSLVSAPKDVVVGFCNDRINYNLPIGTDNCANVTVTQTTGLPSGSIFPVGLTVNTFEVTDPSGNKITTSFSVTVVSETVIDTFPDLEFCADIAPFDLSKGYPNFTFIGSGIRKDRITFDPLLSGAGSFQITAQFKDSMGCVSTGIFTVTVNRVPDKPSIERLSSTRLSANANFEFYQWYRNNEPIAGATNKTLDVTQSGIYGLVVRNSSACVNGSDPFPLGVALGNSGIVKDEDLFNVYPNPSSAKFFIELKGITSNGTQIKIIDMLGKEISSFEATADVIEIDAISYAPGTYYVRLQHADKLLIKPIVIVK